MKKRVLSVLLVVVMMLGLLPTVSLAVDTPAETAAIGGNEAGVEKIDPQDGVVVAPGLVVDNENSAADYDVWTLTSGEHTASGTATETQRIVIQGDVTLTLDGATIGHTTTDTAKYGAAISVMSGTATLVLSGTNEVQGSPGFAGIYVAPDAMLTISGEGSLTAKGGDGVLNDTSDIDEYYCGGGAGIGGNGIWADLEDKPIKGDSANTGTIRIENGKIAATGGSACEAAPGGAGIGTGGTIVSSSVESPSGTIEISGGDV